jgi:hypothetical protein
VEEKKRSLSFSSCSCSFLNKITLRYQNSVNSRRGQSRLSLPYRRFLIP